MTLNQIVNWKECPPSVPASTTRVRGISPCRNYALIDWVWYPVPVKDLSINESVYGYPYKPYADNHWTEQGIDLSTGRNLLEWSKP